jgi:hypothetical protein
MDKVATILETCTQKLNLYDHLKPLVLNYWQMDKVSTIYFIFMLSKMFPETCTRKKASLNSQQQGDS